MSSVPDVNKYSEHRYQTLPKIGQFDTVVRLGHPVHQKEVELSVPVRMLPNRHLSFADAGGGRFRLRGM